MGGARGAVWLAAIGLVGAACIGDPPAAELSEPQRRTVARQIVSAAPAAMQPLDADFGGKLRLLGYTLSPARQRYEPGQRAELTLIWQRQGTIEAGWQLFTHLIDGSDRIASNLDKGGPLRAMKGVAGVPLPPERWPADKIVLDPLRVELPRPSAGPLRIVAGLYRGRDRLEVSGAAAEPTARRVLVAPLTMAPPRASPVKSLEVPQLAPGSTITIDGALSEPAWSQAADTGPFVHAGSGRPVARGAVGGRARLLWNQEHCYAAFEVSDPKVQGGWPTDAVDPHLWERDTVEIMIDPDGDGDNRDYYEIQINPQNLVFDSQFDRYNRPRGGPRGPFGHQQWRSELVSAVQVQGTMDDDSDQDRGYIVEAKLPWSALSKARHRPPRVGDQWRMNFYAMQNNGGAAWSPILGQGNFHRAARFGRVRWSAPAGAPTALPTATPTSP